jgi:2-aminoadipate transaminase
MKPRTQEKGRSRPAAGEYPYRFSRRIRNTPRSFIREILKVTERPEVISFAGGLPNPAMIDTPGLAAAASAVMSGEGRRALQYSTTEGHPALRQFIADRYRSRLDLDVTADDILITNGSQQCLDLIGKILLNPSDHIAIERPGYLGAIQAFSLYEPQFHGIPLDDDGPDPGLLAALLKEKPVRLMYGVPNSQNPSGITWTARRRDEIADVLAGSKALFVEDDAYGELDFAGDIHPPLKAALPDQGIMTGSFSKILSPGMRLGWICAPGPVMERLVTAKQASDLHSNFLSQCIAAEYLAHTDIDTHIRKIRAAYGAQCACMLDRIRREFPAQVRHTVPRGGMFTWVTVPEGSSSMEIFEAALRENVAVLPGIPFYTDGGGHDTLRLNFSNAGREMIRTGIKRLGSVMAAFSSS